MQVKLKYIGIVSRKLNKTDDELDLPASMTVAELLGYLTKLYKLKNRQNPFFIVNKDKNEPAVFVTKNQKLASFDEKIKDNDTIVILPIIAGG